MELGAAEFLRVLYGEQAPGYLPHTAEGAEGAEASSREIDEGSGLLTHTRTTRPHDAKENKLVAAGWTPNERSGKTIWQSPKNGSWYLQELALLLSKKGGRR